MIDEGSWRWFSTVVLDGDSQMDELSEVVAWSVWGAETCVENLR